MGVYIAESFQHEKLTLEPHFDGCEQLWLRISNTTTNINYVIGTIYRYPSSNTKDFIAFFNDILSQLTALKVYYFILGNINSNTNASPSSREATDYLNMLNSNSVASIINIPTRVTKTTSSTLEHILTNENRYTLAPLVVDYDVTDHYPVMVATSKQINTRPRHDKPIFKRSFVKFSAYDFNPDLQVRLDDLFTANYTTNQINVEDLFNRFHSLIIQIIDTHAPVVKYSRKQKRLHQKPWITKGLLVSIKKKQKMRKSHHINGSSCEKYLYKLYSNLLNRLKRLAKRLYYHYQVNACEDNPKKTWDILRSLLPNKSISSALSINGEIVSDPAAILEKFNSHFSNIGQSLVTSITNDSHINDFHSYLKSPCSSSIYLHPTSPQEITTLIYNLDSNKASGYDDISPFIIKTAVQIISLPLSIILNLCISNGVFPNNLKAAKVIPVYKSGCPNEPGNYRPISLLSSIAKIFERVIPNRMVSFLERNNLIISTQFGFRHKHSTIHPILF